jgi:hypothetical protein
MRRQDCQLSDARALRSAPSYEAPWYKEANGGSLGYENPKSHQGTSGNIGRENLKARGRRCDPLAGRMAKLQPSW